MEFFSVFLIDVSNIKSHNNNTMLYWHKSLIEYHKFDYYCIKKNILL